jgi:hypothetical protein
MRFRGPSESGLYQALSPARATGHAACFPTRRALALRVKRKVVVPSCRPIQECRVEHLAFPSCTAGSGEAVVLSPSPVDGFHVKCTLYVQEEGWAIQCELLWSS